MLSDEDIRLARINKEILIDVFEEDSLTPVGYDLRVGERGFSWKKRKYFSIDQSTPVDLEPGDTVVIETYESVQVSKKFSGTVHSMATQVLRRGLSHISTTVDPGWKGKLLISVHNYRDTSVKLQFKDKFCTICFYKTESESKKDVGRSPGRTDIWDELLDIANQEKDNFEKEKKLKELKHLAILIFTFIVIIVLGILGHFIFGVALNTAIISSLTAASVLIPEILKTFTSENK